MLEKKEKKLKKQDEQQETTLHSTEEMVCSPEFTESCVEVEMDFEAGNKEKKD